MLQPSSDSAKSSLDAFKSIKFRVRTSSRLIGVRLSINEADKQAVDAKQIQALVAGRAVELPIPENVLIWGTNTIGFEVEDEKGKWTRELPISIPQPPVALGTVKFDPKDGIRGDGESRRAPRSRITVHGYVEFSDEERDHRNRRPGGVQIWVNGFLQRTVHISTDAVKRRIDFESQVTLSRLERNHVEFRYQGGPNDQAGGRRTSEYLACAKPETAQELQLIVVAGRGSELNEDEVQRLTDVTTNRLIPAFDGRIVSRTLYRNQADRDYLFNTVLWEIAQINDKTNRVVLICYLGEEQHAVHSTEFTLVSGRSRSKPDQDISSTELRETLTAMKGAHLVFLDVHTAHPELADRWQDDPYLGVFRTVWKTEPKSPRLMSAVNAALPNATVLAQVQEQVEKALELYQNKKELVVDFSRRLSEDLKELRFGSQTPNR